VNELTCNEPPESGFTKKERKKEEKGKEEVENEGGLEKVVD